MSFIDAIAVTSIKRYVKRVKDENYLRFIRQFPCVGCGFSGSWKRKIEAAHIGPHALGEKADDCTALPLCPECHRTGPKALHVIGPVDFQAVIGKDFHELQAMFCSWYFLKTGKWPEGWEREQERRMAA